MLNCIFNSTIGVEATMDQIQLLGCLVLLGPHLRHSKSPCMPFLEAIEHTPQTIGSTISARQKNVATGIHLSVYPAAHNTCTSYETEPTELPFHSCQLLVTGEGREKLTKVGGC